jgi:hypothetical protein
MHNLDKVSFLVIKRCPAELTTEWKEEPDLHLQVIY